MADTPLDPLNRIERLQATSHVPAFVGVAVTAVSKDQRHAGILYLEAGTLKYLHLQWHNRLTDDVAPDGLTYVEPALLAQRAKQVAARCRQISRSNGRNIPYGFSSPSNCFDAQTQHFLVGPTTHGLTCASFVLAVFAFAGIHLLDCADWPNRPDDAKWQQDIVNALRQHGAPPGHIAHVINEIGCARYRPEEVLAGAILVPPAASFQLAQPLGARISSFLSR